MILQLINIFIIIIHLFIIFSPILLFFVKLPTWIFKYLLLIPVIIVSHWKWLENQCSLTIIQKKLGFIENKSDSGFSEKYLRWFYEPIMNLLNMPWNNENLDIIINFHWLINFLIIWYFTFF